MVFQPGMAGIAETFLMLSRLVWVFLKALTLIIKEMLLRQTYWYKFLALRINKKHLIRKTLNGRAFSFNTQFTLTSN